MKIKIHTASNEIEASIIKCYLESKGIEASVAPGIHSLGNSPRVLRGPNVAYDVFVAEEIAEDAKALISEMKSE